MRRQVLSLAFAAILVTPAVLSQRAYADGLFQENLPPASIGDRDAILFVKISPPVLTSQTVQDTFLQLRLFDAKTDENIKFATFAITISKSSGKTEKHIYTDAFVTESGLLTIKVQPQEGDVQVFATQEDYLHAWQADLGGTINMKGPVLNEAGLYHLHIELLTVDNIRNLFAPGEQPVFDTYLSVGDVISHAVSYEGKNYPTTIISYYDKVQDFNFEGQSKTYSWLMPFDWDMDRILNTSSLFVHQEIKIPKSFAGVGDAMVFDAAVNGIPVSNTRVSVDPFSSEDELILHLLLSKKDVVELAGKIPEGTATMDFQLSPTTEAEETSTEIATDNGGVVVRLNWEPVQLGANKETILGLEFINPDTGEVFEEDVVYDLSVFDLDGEEIHTAKGLIAIAGMGSQSLTFPADDNYHVEVKVVALQGEGESDTTRNGIARGIVVVPEFPTGTIIAISGALGAIVAFGRLRRT